MVISGKKVYLRTVREKDLDWLYEKECDIELRGLYFLISVSSETTFKENFRKTGLWSTDFSEMLICDLNNQSVVGALYCGMGTPYFDNLEVGYRLFDPQLSGHGIISEALTLFSYVLFISKKINRLELKIFPENAASKRVAEKCGYKFEGVARGAVFHRGLYRDVEIYSLLRHEGPHNLEEALNRIVT